MQRIILVPPFDMGLDLMLDAINVEIPTGFTGGRFIVEPDDLIVLRLSPKAAASVILGLHNLLEKMDERSKAIKQAAANGGSQKVE